MDTEFSFKDLFLYAVKRWFIVALTAILGTVVLVGLFIHNRNNYYNDDQFKGSIKFYSITEFLKDNSTLINTDSPSVEGVYNQTAARVMSYFVEPVLKDEFINDKEVLGKFKIIFDTVIDQKYEFKSELIRNISMGYSTTNFDISFTGKLDTKEKEAAAIWLINNYMDRAIAYAFKQVDTAYIPYNAVTKYEPVRMYFEEPESDSIVGAALKGFVFGAVAGVAIIALIYFLDPRVKSHSQIKLFAPNLIAKVQCSEPEAEPVLNICARIKDSKVTLVAAPKDDVFVSKLAKSVAMQYQSMGLKTLVVDFASNDGALLSDYLRGKKEIAGDVLSVASADEWAQLMSREGAFGELSSKYDKIIIAYSDIYNGGAVVLSGLSDKTVLAINQKVAKANDVIALAADFKKSDMCVGAYIYNSI